jgi:hypothetical protein
LQKRFESQQKDLLLSKQRANLERSAILLQEATIIENNNNENDAVSQKRKEEEASELLALSGGTNLHLAVLHGSIGEVNLQLLLDDGQCSVQDNYKNTGKYLLFLVFILYEV